MISPYSHEANSEVAELQAALKANGITLPSLGLDLPSVVMTYGSPLVELGNCNLDTARALTAALRKAAGR
jgi:D-alanyl-D-alanine carboxypeptidase